jgi:hypothetical protein
MDAVIGALVVGVRVTIWIFTRIYMGYVDAFRWLEARNRGEYYAFPVGSFSLSVILTIFLLGFCMMTQTAPR